MIYKRRSYLQMSKFNNFTPDMVEQINDLDDKLVQVIKLVKQLEKRVKAIENIASTKGLLKKKVDETNDDSCLVM